LIYAYVDSIDWLNFKAPAPAGAFLFSETFAKPLDKRGAEAYTVSAND